MKIIKILQNERLDPLECDPFGRSFSFKHTNIDYLQNTPSPYPSRIVFLT